ncbi:MAG TPA: DNA repair exonuclease [Pseudomonadales bacterium]|nr:DNA repair exonuclease [Pseudomonadales bacterium]
MKQRLDILHTSDIHLDNQIGGPGQESSGQTGLKKVVDAALAMDVDLFLLAGDLFDHNRVGEACLEFASQQLARVKCPVVMVTGNHDCLADYSVYHRYDPRLAGDHIRFITEEAGGQVDFHDLGLRVWGRGIVDHHPGNKPLEQVPEHELDTWYVGVTHGYYVNRGAEMFSSLITPEEVEASGLDYLALGHVHVFSTMQHGKTIAAYPGSPNLGQGASEMTAAHVTLDPEAGVTVARILL